MWHLFEWPELLVFSFSSCSCEIRLMQCLHFDLLDATLNSLTGYVFEKTGRFLTA